MVKCSGNGFRCVDMNACADIAGMTILETPYFTVLDVTAMCNNLDTTVGAPCLRVAFRYELDVNRCHGGLL